ncbi:MULTISPECIES: DUF4911 domain-containing protein [unclassified Candidatus Frackibacter]|uniref:DUF4911 domain-containing protein n=1 Tax=unclassified Candidatus Frackibacter TaxID=2648818 RepID=UPI0008859F20|nr:MULTISPECIES: DUF4911 domain-containing protein [unclassified Candidatus Frackibacter]SDC86822.1 protein of unknown function [Candidatus Frackibacter sp. WG11]SEN01048.1 protein of unknown function [Candidatus Frackibacter sp. WG12]SFM08444.1 protein of unknown function [Candidatus Frackibacter sp. WG13]
MDTITIKIEVEKSEMAFVDKIIKAYEGLAMVTVVGGERGLMKLEVPPSNKQEILEILDDLANKVKLKIVEIEK